MFFYYSHGRDWKHPHAPNNDNWPSSARPAYDPPDPNYKYGDEHDLNIYIEFMNNQIRELLEMFQCVNENTHYYIGEYPCIDKCFYYGCIFFGYLV